MAAATLLKPGDIVGGFEVEDLIGIGGMATVYRARQVSLGRPVALKVLSRQFTGDETFRERFRREGMHAASLEHPNIVPVYDSGELDGLLYLAMRYVEGQSLAELLSSQGVTADRAIEIMQPIASALDCAHAAGLIHRDIKPQNILITNQGHPYLADFGVAKDANAPGLTATGGFVGSVNYASPEQIKGLTLTASSDIYALTAVLYHCLSGDVPYPGESEAGVMHAHLNQPPPTLPALEGADSEFHSVFARGMAKDPGARYGHAGDLINAAAVCVSRMPSERRKSIPAFPKKGRPKAAAEAVEASTEDAVNPAKEREHAAATFGSMTAVDQRREPAPPEEPPEAPRKRRLPRPKKPAVPRPKLPNRPKLPAASGLTRKTRPTSPNGAAAVRRRRIAAAVGGGALVCLVIALIVLGGGSDDASEKTVRKGAVQLSYAGPWRTGAPASVSAYGLHLQEPVALDGRDGSSLLAGKLANGAPVPGGLPPALAAELSGRPARKTVGLGGASAIRYTSTARKGHAEVAVYVIPTDTVDIAVLCAGGAGASCAKTATTLRVIGLHPVAPGADRALAAELSATLAPLGKARSHPSDLEVSQPASRAKSIRALAAADTKAAEKLDVARPEPRDRAEVRALSTALRREATALNEVASAARTRDYAKYGRAAKAAHTAGRSVKHAIAALRRSGFAHIPKLRPLAIPPLPRPEPQPEPELAESSEPSAPIESAPPVTSTPEPAPEPEQPKVIISKPE